MTSHLVLTWSLGSGHKVAASKIGYLANQKQEPLTEVDLTHDNWLSFSYTLAAAGLISDKFAEKHPMDIGQSIMKLWNWAWKKGYHEILQMLNVLNGSSPLANKAFTYKTYKKVTEAHRHNPHEPLIVHNTQPICISGIIKAIANYNREIDNYNITHPCNPKSHAEFVNILTDMPTARHEGLAKEINSIDPHDLIDARITFYMPKPIIDLERADGDMPQDLSSLTEQQKLKLYHLKTAERYPVLYQRLSDENSEQKLRVVFTDGPIRDEFLAKKQQLSSSRPEKMKTAKSLTVKFTNEDELTKVQKLIKEFLDTSTTDNNTQINNSSNIPSQLPREPQQEIYKTLNISKKTEVISIMLGSIASTEGILGLVRKEIKATHDRIHKQKKQDNSDLSIKIKPKIVFVFCNKNEPENPHNLYQQTLSLAKDVYNNSILNKHITIVPLSYQNGPMIADLYAIADRIITRPGGLSIMEVEAVSQHKVIAFSDISKFQEWKYRTLHRYTDDDLEKLLSKKSYSERLSELMPWEAGNTEHAMFYLRDDKNRTRVSLTNIYGYDKELNLSRHQKKIDKLIKQKQYQRAYHNLTRCSRLRDFIATGNDQGAELACLAALYKNNNLAISKLNELLKTLTSQDPIYNDIQCSISNLIKANNIISQQTSSNQVPSEIFGYLKQMQLIAILNLNKAIDHISNNDENTPLIKKALISIRNLIINTIRFILGLSPSTSTMTRLKHVDDLYTTHGPKKLITMLNNLKASSEVPAALANQNTKHEHHNDTRNSELFLSAYTV